MAVLEAFKWASFSQASEEATSTEGKTGVPRFDGGTAKLSEHAFRAFQAREKTMEETELRKLGPLALRLVDGLRGPALQVARTVPVGGLAGEKGVEFLLKSLNQQAPGSPQQTRSTRTISGGGPARRNVEQKGASQSPATYFADVPGTG